MASLAAVGTDVPRCNTQTGVGCKPNDSIITSGTQQSNMVPHRQIMVNLQNQIIQL
jgi:hypothetical protein